MDIGILIIFYAFYAAFWGRFFVHGLLWCRSSAVSGAAFQGEGKSSPTAWFLTGTDILFFRRVFETSKILWAGSWTFHVCLFFVLLSHLRYFLVSVPDILIPFQSFGIAAGYVLPVSLVVVMAVRIANRGRGYVSPSNAFILTTLLLLSLTGLLLRTVARPDLVSVKEFTIGILTFRPHNPPDSVLFLFHAALFLVIFPYLPFHIFAAPFVALAARQRAEDLTMVIHER